MKVSIRSRARPIAAALLWSLIVAQTAIAGPFEQGEDGTGVTPSLAASNTKIRFRLILPLRHERDLDRLLEAQADPASSLYRQWISSKSFSDRFLPTASQLASASAVARATGLTVVGTDAHSIVVEASAVQIDEIYRTQLRIAKRTDGSRHVVAAGPLMVPAKLASFGANTPAFANVVTPKPTAQRAIIPLGTQNRNGRSGPYWFTDLKQAYDYPAYNAIKNGKAVDGSGASVAVIMSGDASDSDVRMMFQHEHWSKYTTSPIPTIKRLLVDGGPSANTSSSAAVEAALDVQMVLGGAPGAATTLVEIPDLADDHLIDALTNIVDSNSFDIVSMSIGGPQNLYLPGYNGGSDYRYILRQYNALFKQGCAQGMTFIAGSGDQGGLASPSVNYFDKNPDDRPVFVPGVSFLSDSPYVTSVGGGNLVTSTDGLIDQVPSAYVVENGDADRILSVDMFGLGKAVRGGFWGAGGGISFAFPRPTWQVGTPTGVVSARTEPDVGMQVGGCPGDLVSDVNCGIVGNRSAVYVYVNGSAYPLIGTSVSAPEFASAVALFVGQNGRQGNLNPYLYAMARAQARGGALAFHQGQQSFDGYWSGTDQGGYYNYIFGNGSPDVRVLFGFTDVQPAGVPGSVSNP